MSAPNTRAMQRAAKLGRPHIWQAGRGWWWCDIPGRPRHAPGSGSTPTEAYLRWAFRNPDAPLSARRRAAERWPT